MNNNFLKIYFLILTSFLGYSQQNIASIEIVHFDSSLNYAPGSSVSIHFNPLGIYDFRDDGDDNQFYIELSNSSGTFDNDTVVLDQSISDSFFTTTLNGVIPTINEVGTYKLRVIATKALLSNGSYGQLSSSTSVDITILTNVTGDILTTYSSTPNSGDLFDCSDQGVFHTDAMFGLLLAESSTTSGEIFANRRKIRVTNFDSNTADYNIKRVDVINDNIFDIGSLPTSSHTISGNLGIGTYNFQVTKTLSNGVSSSYSIVFVLHRSTTTIANDSGEEICVGNIVNFNIDTNNAGIGQNYRGSYYTIDFGDDSDLELYTHAEILYDNTLSHVFDNLSCNLDSGFFVVDKQQFNKYRISNSSNCEYRNIGNGVQKNINTSLSPEAFFDSDSICEDQDLIVTNLTTLGQYGTNGCLDDATFYWEISNPNGDEFSPAFEYGDIIDDPNGWLTTNDNPENNLLDITIPSSQVIAGCWEFRLIAINDDFCQTVSYFPPQNQSPYIVNVETFPENTGIFDFDIMSDNQEVSSICVGGSVSLIDNSNLNNLNCQNPSYQWTISPNSGYSFINNSNPSSQNLQIIFTEAGVYTITQEITNLCGTTTSSQELLIEGSPSVSFSNSSDQICVISTSIPYVVDFSSMYIPNYSDIPYAPSSFLWSISGANVDQSDYNFINGTSANDPYPIISFNDFRDFTINLTVDGDCQDSNSDQIILFINQIPEINNSNNSQTLCSGDFTNDILFESSFSSGVNYSWTTNSDSNISGYFNNGVGSGLPSHQLTNISNVSGNVTYTVTPYTNDCIGESIDFTFTIDPKPIISDKTLVICTNQSFNLINSLTSSDILPEGTIFTWDLPISSPDNAVSGGVQGSNSNIIQTLTNNTTSPATLSYLVSSSTPQDCNGNNFNLNVIVNPTAQVDQPLDQVVCNLDEVSVLFSTQNTGGSTSYSWVSDTQIGAGLSGTGDMAFTATNITTEPLVAIITVTPTFENGGIVCDGEDKTFTITVNPNADMNGIENQVVCHGESTESIIFSTNNLNGVMSYTWTNDTPSIGLSDSGSGDILAFTATNTTSTPITAIITVTPTFGFDNVVCDGEQKIFTITVNPTAQVEQPQDQTVCNGDDVIVEFFTNNAVGNISYSWFADIDIGLGLTGEGDLNFTAINQTTSPIISNISVVSTFEDGLNNCTGAVKNFVIKVNPTAQVNPVQDVFICEGEISSVIDFTTINSNGIVSYTWINDNTDIGLITNGVGSIESFVAENPTNEIITANLIVTPTYSNDGVLCLGPSENFSISVSPKPEMNEVITNVNCSYSEPLCIASIQISPDGIGPFVYNWVSLDGNDIINPSNQDQFDLCPGSYRVTVTDGSSCSYSYEYQVSPPESIEFTLVTLTNLSCNNIGSEFCDGSIEVLTDGGSYPYAIQEWYTESIPGSGDFDLGPLVNINSPNQLVNACQGNYVYKVLDANGCEFISPVYTIDAAPSQVNISETISNYNGYNIDCFSSNSGLLEIEVSGGSGIFDFSLTNDQTGQIIDSSQNQIGPLNLVFDFLTAGDYTFILIDSNCSSEIIRNYNLTEPDELQIIATLVSPPTCYSGLATYDISATGGVPPYIGTGLQSVLSGPASFTVIDSNDCSDDYSTIVADPEELSVEYSTEDALCFGGNGLITINPDGGTGIITVNIYDENFLFIESSLTSQSTPISFIQPNGTYFFDFYDDNNCYFGPQLVVINEPEPILVDIDIIQPNCNSDPEWSFNNGSICILVTGGINPMPIGANWIDNGNGNWCLTDLSDGTYPVVIVDENGCEPINEIQNVVLTSPTPITVDFNNSIDVDCDTNTITQTNFIFVDGGQPPYEITWSGGIYDPLNSNIMETSVEGNYSAFVNDQLGILNGCPPLEFQLDPIIFQEFGYSDFTFSSANSDFCDIFAVSDPISFTNISNGDIVNFEWNFGDGSPIITNIQSPTHVYDVIGDYTVILTVEDVYGCTDSYSQIIEITKGYEIINPNAFTPNGDGINDTIRPVYNCMTNVKMSIYDTWGSLIYTESGEDIYGWDGNIDGNPAENGNYIMVVEAETFNGTVLNLNGPVTLIK